MSLPVPLDQSGGTRIVFQGTDRAVLNSFYDGVDDIQGYEIPFPWADRFAEPVCYFDIQPCVREEPMQERFQPDAINVEKFIGRNDFNICEEICCVVCRISDASLDLAAGHAQFVDQIAMLRDPRIG